MAGNWIDWFYPWVSHILVVRIVQLGSTDCFWWGHEVEQTHWIVRCQGFLILSEKYLQDLLLWLWANHVGIYTLTDLPDIAWSSNFVQLKNCAFTFRITNLFTCIHGVMAQFNHVKHISAPSTRVLPTKVLELDNVSRWFMRLLNYTQCVTMLKFQPSNSQVLYFDPSPRPKNAIPRWYTGRKWHIPTASNRKKSRGWIKAYDMGQGEGFIVPLQSCTGRE